MESELTIGERGGPGPEPQLGHSTRSLALHETPCFSGDRPLNRGLFHTGCGGGPAGAGEPQIFTLNTAIQAVGEGNYGRLGAEQQRRYTEANVETMFAEPATNGTPDEQPGAMPEIVPSPAFGKNIDRCWTCRSMFLQSWGNLGTAWPVVHQQLGVRPDLGRGALTVVPQLPSGAPIAGRDIRLGDGELDLVAASRDGDRYRTTVDARHVPVKELWVGHTLPSGSKVRLGQARRAPRPLERAKDEPRRRGDRRGASRRAHGGHRNAQGGVRNHPAQPRTEEGAHVQANRISARHALGGRRAHHRVRRR